MRNVIFHIWMSLDEVRYGGEGQINAYNRHVNKNLVV